MIEELKKDSKRVHRVHKEGDDYGIRVLGRGENLFFQKNDKAFICQIDAVGGIIFGKSINNWDDGSKIRSDERKEVLNTLISLYKEFYSDEVIFDS
jgi:hypothetical protein